MRLQNCRNFPPAQSSPPPSPPAETEAIPAPSTTPAPLSVLLKWLQRLQFKMAQIELQSSNVTQFYFV